MTVDARAHQVFVGFSAREIRRALSNRCDDDAVIEIRSDGEVQSVSLAALDEISVPDSAVFVFHSQNPVHPGGVNGLVWVVDRLLGPGGCPWDQEQTHESLKRHLIEECYEMLQAIDSGDLRALKEETGDVLLQPVMHAQMEAIKGGWDTDAVAQATADKLVRRHPHVFGDTRAKTAEEVLKHWDAIKAMEKGGEPDSVLAGVPIAMPALLRAFEVSKRAARSGFEWPNVEGVWAKLDEEQGELHAAISGGDINEIESEIGDLLFTVVNLARWVGVEPEDALRRMVDRFTSRFQAMERRANRPLRELSAQEWDALWEAAKADS